MPERPTPPTTLSPTPRLRLPAVVDFAQARFNPDGMTHTWHTHADLVAWAETSVLVPISCCPRRHPQTDRRVGALRHWMALDPHTGHLRLAPRTETEATKVAARHTLWALTNPLHTPPACMQVEAVLERWVGPVHPGDHAPWSRSGAAADRMRAARTMMRTVQYLDAGLDLNADVGWLAIGAPPHVVAWCRALLAANHRPRAEDRLVGFLQHKVGMSGTLKVGQKAVTDTPWLCQVARDWVAREFAISHRDLVEPPWPFSQTS